jgi:thymidylate kinase
LARNELVHIHSKEGIMTSEDDPKDIPSSSENNTIYDNSPYLNCASSYGIPGLCHDFSTAATMVRIARSELQDHLVPNGSTAIDEFYSLLRRVEAYIMSTNHNKNNHNKFIVEIEGLDGSGKTTLVQNLALALGDQKAIATKTPSKCLKSVRPVFDHRGGPIARAFYMLSNYILAYEIENEIEQDVVIVDRWYASTVSYTVAFRGDRGSEAEAHNTPSLDMSSLPDSIFEWPRDLHLKPNLLLILHIDPHVRNQRVSNRIAAGGGASLFNPWDDRLAKDSALGERILQAFQRVQVPNVALLNANASAKEVLEEALSIFHPMHQKTVSPEQYFAHAPLDWWRFYGQQMNLCTLEGKRCHHALWNLQISYQNKHERDEESSPPILKTVGLDHMDSECIYFWTSASTSIEAGSTTWASVCSVAGEYPLECQWRAEGFLVKVTPEECQLQGYTPPPSLLAHLTACANETNTTRTSDVESSRTLRSDMYDQSVEKARQNPNDAVACLIRFVPVRVEVLRGGPSTRGRSGYPQRWEWSRGRSDDGDQSERWNIRSILPFTTKTFRPVYQRRGITLVLTGCHASGKA